MNKRSVSTLVLAFFAAVLIATAANEPVGIAAKTAGMTKLDGFVPLYWDQTTGKMWMEISRFDQEFLYLEALSAGVGSNDLGLDRGRMEESKVMQFQRVGPRVLFVESNYAYRASSPNPLEQKAEKDSFARSALWGFDVAAEEGGSVLVDATAFLLRDAVNVGGQISHEKQGTYRLDQTRCAFYLPLTKTFPKNTEVETTITLTGEPSGTYIREVTPSPEAITFREHQGFVALPDPGFHTRLQDPRSAFGSVDFMDFSTPVGEPLMKRLAVRHRLEKKDPSAAMSDPVAPLVYYVDSGAPAKVQQALIEGASWWNQAFETAGFRGAFQVKPMPPDMDAMDARYNVIQWVHRSTRGWSYGNSIVDPRTGEIIKGIVTLGSQRQYQDYLIFEGLMAPHVPGNDRTSELTAVVYARLRQLAAHEVGHTLGLEHNYIASTQGRASVMDYPGPQIDITPDGKLDLSHAYAVGIGEWDKVSIQWGYSQFASGADETVELNKILMDAAKRGLTFITDADSRPPGSPHPKSHLWDNGTNAVDELTRMLEVRKIALSQFGENNITEGTPLATLGDVLVPLYFLHRYQTEAASKSLGGNEYSYALRGDGQRPTQIVAAAEQRRALKVLLTTIDPATLTLPDRILNLIPPRPPAYPRTRESFPNQSGLTFDPIAGAQAAAELTIGLILNPQRAARLVEYHARDAAYPGLEEVIETLIGATWRPTTKAAPKPALQGEVSDVVRIVALQQLLRLAMGADASVEVRSIAAAEIQKNKRLFSDAYSASLVAKFEDDPEELDLPKPVEAPPGQPIGSDDYAFWPF
jgi:hypothetical protein